MFRALLFSISFCFGLHVGIASSAAPPDEQVGCKDNVGGTDKVTVQILYFWNTTKECSLEVHADDTPPGAKGDRNFAFQSDGQIMAFTSMNGSKKNSKSTGARVFYLFPRKGLPTFEVFADESIAVRTPSGDLWRFSGTTGRPLSFSGGEFKEASEVSLDNQGGFEIPKYKGLLMDCGWRSGEAPIGDSKRSCVFRDPAGLTCSVGNPELFKRNGESIVFRYPDDKSLLEFITKRCSKLDARSLIPAASAPAAGDAVEKPAANKAE